MSLGTAATVGLALGAIGGQTAANIYGTRTAGKQNKKAMEASERSDTRAADLEARRLSEEAAAREADRAEERRNREASLAEERRWREDQAKLQREADARKERLYNEAVGRDRERYQEYLKAWQPHWQSGSGVLNSLYDIAGFQGQRVNPAANAAALSPTSAPPTLGSVGPSDAPVSSTMPVGRSWGTDMGVSGGGTSARYQPRQFAQMEMPTPRGMSLIDLAQMASAASRVPKASYTGGVNLSAMRNG